MTFEIWLFEIMLAIAGVDPGFFVGGGAPLRNDVADGEVKKKIKSKYVYTKKKASSQERRLHTPCTLP